MNSLKSKILGIAVIAMGLGGVVPAIAAAPEIFLPVLSYRTGPYAPNGVPFFNGFVDYLKLVNVRDKGANGIPISYEECEFGYDAARGMECYERLKSRNPVAINPLSTGLLFQLTAKAADDKIPLFSAGYGRSDSVDGTVFPWNFPLLGTYWTAADILVQHLTKIEGGSLKGKKIALVYHDSAFGKEPIAVFEAHAKTMGFEFIKLPVPTAGGGVEQSATWLQIRRDQPDYVMLWGWGAMNPAAIRGAVSVGYPRSRMYGVWWSASEPDVTPVSDAAVGYNGLTLMHSAENSAPVHQAIVKHLYAKEQGSGKQEEIGSVLYNRGLITAMLMVESIRTAQAKYGKKPVTGEQVRWGAENLNLNAARLKALGFEGMLHPVKTSCADHSGAGAARLHTWDGKQWRYSSDWYEADKAFLKPIIEASAKKYAEEKKIQPRDCSKPL
jgi:branched-chain amino acid transport system substrate-binding protein